MNLFKRKNNDDLTQATITQTRYDNNGALNEAIQIMANDGVNICSRACAVCWDSKLPTRYSERAEYIAKRTRIGHASVIEHSNNVYYLEIPDLDLEDLAEFLSIAFYVHTVYRHSKKYNKGYLIIGGSWRAYRDLFLKLPDFRSNKVMIKLISIINSSINSCAFADLINMGELDKTSFIDTDLQYATLYSKQYNADISEYLYCENIDNLDILVQNLAGVCPEAELFNIYDLLDMVTITILFKNMSRIITQQLTRHRNAITQESQRYVDYSDGMFNSPAKFRDYDPEHQYSIQFGKSSQKMNLQEIGDAIVGIYRQLADKDRNGNYHLLKEDARGYLPNNTVCNKIYITFTWRSFFAFLDVREDKAAQSEIRGYACTLGDWFRGLYPQYFETGYVRNGYLADVDLSTIFYKPINTDSSFLNGVDAIISEEEIVEEMENYVGSYEEDSKEQE